MNKVILMGRLTRDPEVRYSQGEQCNSDRKIYTGSRPQIQSVTESQTADFIGCVAFGKRSAEFAEKYLRTRNKGCLLPDVSRQEAIRTKTVRKYTQQMWLLKSM